MYMYESVTMKAHFIVISDFDIDNGYIKWSDWICTHLNNTVSWSIKTLDTEDLTFSASQITSGTLGLARGGTGASTAAAARTALGAAASSHTHTVANISNITISSSNPSGGSNGAIWFKYS